MTAGVVIHQVGVEFAGTQLCHLCGATIVERTEGEAPPVETPFGGIQLVTSGPATRFYHPGVLVAVTPTGEQMVLSWSEDADVLCNGNRVPPWFTAGWCR